MKIDFDTFEFAGLVAPGVVIVVAALLLWQNLVKSADAAVIIVVALLGSYVVGHFVAAVGNIAEPLFQSIGVQGLESLPYADWERRQYIAPDQKERLQTLIHTNLHRNVFLDGPEFKEDSPQRKTVVKQMYMAVAGSEKPQRVTTFDGLYSLSRGLAVSLLICAIASLFFGRYAAAVICLAGVYLALYRMRKFKRAYCRELLQQFLLLDERVAPTS